jgi:preprotein translocase subunit SecE
MAFVKNSERPKAEGGFFSRLKKPGKGLNRFREVWIELKKVHWPTRNQLLTYTGVVLVSVGIVAVLIWIVDSGLSFAIGRLLGS